MGINDLNAQAIHLTNKGLDILQIGEKVAERTRLQEIDTSTFEARLKYNSIAGEHDYFYKKLSSEYRIEELVLSQDIYVGFTRNGEV